MLRIEKWMLEQDSLYILVRDKGTMSIKKNTKSNRTVYDSKIMYTGEREDCKGAREILESYKKK